MNWNFFQFSKARNLPGVTVKALYEQDMDVMLGDDINKLLEGGYLLCQDCMGHLLPGSGDINILEINIDICLYYITLYLYLYLYWDTNGQKSMAKKKPNPRSIDMYRYSKWRVLFHYVDHMICKIKGLVWFGLVTLCGPPTLTKPEEDCYSGGKSSTRSHFLFRLTRRLPLTQQ